jgi:hypothetical protein
MGRIEWFRRWRYDDSTRLAQDQELLLRSYRNSRFANLPQIVIGYREEGTTRRGLFKLLQIPYDCTQPGPGHAWRKLRRIVIPAARFAANCIVVLGGEPRMDHQAAQATSAEPAEWRNLWTLLAIWSGRPCSETFLPSSFLRHARSRQWPEDRSCA